ncbi:glycosyltransferase family 4 protein [Syntrophomonas erecta]
MQILQIHNLYQNPGGEDVVLDMEKKLLSQKGHQVKQLLVSNRDINISRITSEVNLALNTMWSRNNYRYVYSVLNNINPDIIHVHNTFPLLSPSIYWAINKKGVPIVQTLHNYRLICTNALLMRDNMPCTGCVGHLPVQALRYKCYRNSLAATGTIVGMQVLHRIMGTYKKKVDAYIALTGFARSIMAASGLPRERVYVKPNFIYNSKLPIKNKRVNKVVFVGRLSPEKGLDLLLNAWKALRTKEVNLVIIGDGPEEKVLKKQFSDLNNVEWKGWCNKEQIFKEMATAKFLIMPSRWYETFGLVIIEAFSVGLPVIVPNHAGFPEIVKENETGYLFTPNSIESLKDKLIVAIDLGAEEWQVMSQRARAEYEAKYTPQINYEILMNIYEDVIRKKRVNKR